MELVIRPLQWGVLPDLPDAPPIDADDLACLEEMRTVLARHGKLNRFAVHLAHSHFELAPGEVLIERPDPDGRTQHVTVGRLDDAPDAVPTTWLFDDAPAAFDLSSSGAIYCVCSPTPLSQGACARHGKSSDLGEQHRRNKTIEDRTIAEENYHYEQGFPVAGHDPRERARRRSEED